MNLFLEIKKITFLFFAFLGLLHFLAGMFFVNGYFKDLSGPINRILFLPFLLSGLLYAYASFRGETKWLDYLVVFLGIFLVLSYLGIELLFQDSRTPLFYD